MKVKTKRKIDEMVEGHLPFLKGIETFNELICWKLGTMGIMNPTEHAYLDQKLRANGINVEKLFAGWNLGISKEEFSAEMKRYDEKVDKWNLENS